MSTLAANNITDAAGGNTARVNGFTPTLSNMAGRNRIINGDMRIDQRNNGAALSPIPINQYTVDRLLYNASQAGKFNFQQNAFSTAGPDGFPNCAGFSVASAYTATASEFFSISQRIEGFNIADLGWGTSSAKTVTLSFWVRSSLTGLHSGGLANGSFTRSYPYSFSITAANTWEYKTITIPGDTTGTWNTTNGVGVGVVFNLGCGSDRLGTAGAWVGTEKIGVTGAVSVMGTNGATFYITGVQLEAGSVATPFERRPYGTELALCQRYYQTNLAGVGGAGSATQCAVTFPLVPQMRAAPSTTLLNGTLALDELYTSQRTASSISSTWGLNDGTKSMGITLETTGLTAFRTTTLFAGRVGLSAEL